ncbi:MAG: amidase [Proteobacteria bacterium]|nr:amidase [Pseudomonadota bacterium]MBI3497669.1 amidase [Pseudomonadota bacterium]
MKTVMSWDAWMSYDALGLAELVRRKEVTPRDLAEQVAAGIAKVNPAIGAVVEVFEDVVADPLKDGMRPDGIFAGVPYLMKDLGPTLKGRKQEMGARLMQGNVATADSFLTTRIRQAGLNIMGRTTTPEFGVCGSVENEKVYVSRNPWDRAYTTGGSSAGTGAAIAAGVIPLSHASDGGGSIRIPAGINGTIGLKPSRGVFSAAPEGSDLMAVVSVQGCHSRTVRDTAAFFDACRGGAPGEFMSYWTPDQPYQDLIRRDPRKLKIALSHEWGDYRATPHIAGELERAGRFLEGLGHRVEWRTPAIDFRAAYAAQTACYITNIAMNLERLTKLRGHARPSVEWIEPMNVRIWEAGIDMRYSARAEMQATFNQTSRGFGIFFEDWDILLTPISTLTTHRLGTLDYITLNATDTPLDWFAKLWGMYAYTPLGNLCGIPAISLPMAAHDNGLPLGIHALSRQANDGLLLQLAAQIERALDGKWNGGRRPGVHVTMA